MSRTEPNPDIRAEPNPVLETIMRIVAKVAKISPDEIRPENPVTGITNVDSILLLEIVALTELELGIEIPEEVLFAMTTVAEFVAVCQRLTPDTVREEHHNEA
jgi:acyl carrier protein